MSSSDPLSPRPPTDRVPSALERRLAALEQSVRDLEAAAGRETERRKTGARVRIAVVVALAAFYGYYLWQVVGLMGVPG